MASRPRRGSAAPPTTPPRRQLPRKRKQPPRSPEADEAIESGCFKDSPQKLAFYIAYSNAIAAGEIGRGKRASKAKTEKLAQEHNVRYPRDYFCNLKKQVTGERGRINRKKREGDMMILERDTNESAEMRKALEDYALAQKFMFTYEDAEMHMRVKCGFNRGCSDDSIRRFINKPANGWKIVSRGTVPLLTEKQKKDRLDYALARLKEGDTRWIDHFDVDEKWFYGWAHGQKCKVPPEHARPKKPLQHKSHIPKVIFLVATAQPRPDKGFDGKIGFWEVTEKYTAKRSSKNHAKGDVYERPCTMTAEKYYEMMTQKVFPAARKRCRGQLSCAVSKTGWGPHTGKDNVNKLNIAGAITRKREDGRFTPKITVSTQPAQSPCTNINDLAIFPSMSRRFQKKQKHEVINDLNKLAKNARKTWKEFPTDVLTKAWKTKTNVLRAIVKAKGGNNFNLPHAKDLEDFDWDEIFEGWEE